MGNDEMNDALKPCPFCGGKSEIERRGSARVSLIILCKNCGCTVESGDVYGMTPVENYKWNARAKPSGDAVQVWVVYKVEDDSHHIFSTKEKAEVFANSATEPTVICDYIIDHPERYYVRTN